MRTNRLAIYILTPLTIISLLLAIILRNCSDFTSNVLLSIFGSSLLALIMAIISYFCERRKTMRDLYFSCSRFLNFYSKLIKINGVFDIYELRDIIDEWINYYNDYLYISISQALTIRKGSKLYLIVKELWDNVSKIYLFICEDNENIQKVLIGELSVDSYRKIGIKCSSSDCLELINAIINAHKQLAEKMHFFDKKLQEDNNNAD
ncbi:MAG: hypothetical protein IJ731_03945 [Eubacterium sp.]|nr:hypothetical protein [Eubacterium sp.]